MIEPVPFGPTVIVIGCWRLVLSPIVNCQPLPWFNCLIELNTMKT